jgi:hypothetical protein
MMKSLPRKRYKPRTSGLIPTFGSHGKILNALLLWTDTAARRFALFAFVANQ